MTIGKKNRVVSGIFSFVILANFPAFSAADSNFSNTNAGKSIASEKCTRIVDYSPASKHTLNFKNMDNLLDKFVWETGRSNRKYATRPWVRVERIIKGNPNPTRLEANRFFFHLISPQNLAEIEELLESFQATTETVPLSGLNRDEQLAYWLNLHNLVVISIIATDYPVANLEELYLQHADRKFLNIAGCNLSLNDIRFRILAAHWQDPLVFYGLYYGAVGGPNIRKDAFYGTTVYDQLKSNAQEFVNSLRGVRFRRHTLLISPIYQWNAPFFGEQGTDILKHLQRFAEGEVADRMARYENAEYSKFDWYIADLFNGRRPDPIGAVVPPHVVQLLQNVQDRNKLREAHVEIEEYITDTEQTP